MGVWPKTNKPFEIITSGRKKLKIYIMTERYIQASDLIWTCEETIPILRRKTNTGDGEEEGKRRRGRPRLRWMGCVNRDMRAIGTAEDEVRIYQAAIIMDLKPADVTWYSRVVALSHKHIYFGFSCIYIQ